MGNLYQMNDIYNSQFCDVHNCQKIEKILGKQKKWFCEVCTIPFRGRQSSDDEQIAKFRSKRLAGLKLSKDLKTKDLDNFDIYEISQQKLVDDLRNYVDVVVSGEVKSNLLLIGPTGTGKSHLATGILKLLNEKWMLGKSIGFISSFKLAQQVMSSWGVHDSSSRDICNEFSELDFLVIDDFGFDDEGPKMKILQKILFLRHENGKPTIITSNLLEEGCLEIMDDRIKSRFWGNLHKCITVKCADYRLKDVL